MSFAEEDFLKNNLLTGSWNWTAGYGEYDNKSGNIKFSENVRLESKSSNDVLEFKEGTFNLINRTGEMIDGVLFISENNLNISGAVIQKEADDTYRFEDFSLSTCDNDSPSWSITGSELKVVIEGYGRLKNGAFRIKNVPILYLPYMIFPAKTKRQTGLLLPQFDISDINGYGIEIPFFWAISDDADATLYERYIIERGFMQGLEFRYIADKKSKGEFLFDILRDKIEAKDLTDRDQAEISPFERNNQDRYWLRGRLDQEWSHNLTTRLDLDLVSDQDYLREFEGEFVGIEGRPDLTEDFGRPVEERYSSFRRSAFRISGDREDYSIQGSGYFYQLPQYQWDDDTAQPLAGIFYSLLPKKLLKFPFFVTFDTEYNYLWRDKGISGHSLSFKPKLSYPKQLGDYLRLNSSISYTGSMEAYDAAYDEKDNIVKDAYQAEAGLSTVLERIFTLGWHNVTRLKHKITPSVTYEYSTHSDEQDESLWFDPIDSGSKTNSIGLSFENLLDASIEDKNGGVSYRQWARLDITQRYDLDMLRREDISDADKEIWEPLLATLILRPLKALNLRTSAAWDHYEDRVSRTVLSANFFIPRSGDMKDGYYIDYVEDESNNKSLNLRAYMKLINGLSVGGLLNRDLDLRYNIHKNLWMKYQAQCWLIMLGIEKEDADRKIIWKFQLTGF